MKVVMKCPKCSSKTLIKSGFVREKQRYGCKNCFYNFTCGEKRISDLTKDLAIRMYQENIGFRKIARILGVNHVSVLEWISRSGVQRFPQKNEEQDMGAVNFMKRYMFRGLTR